MKSGLCLVLESLRTIKIVEHGKTIYPVYQHESRSRSTSPPALNASRSNGCCLLAEGSISFLQRGNDRHQREFKWRAGRRLPSKLSSHLHGGPLDRISRTSSATQRSRSPYAKHGRYADFKLSWLYRWPRLAVGSPPLLMLG